MDWERYELASRDFGKTCHTNLLIANALPHFDIFARKIKPLDERSDNLWAHGDFVEPEINISQHRIARNGHVTIFYEANFIQPETEAFRKAYEDFEKVAEAEKRVFDIKDNVLLLRDEQLSRKASAETVYKRKRKRAWEINIWAAQS